MTEKTPEEMAQKEVNKRVGRALADLEIKVREYKAKIKKLEKKKQKILDGEIVPPARGSVLDDLDDDEDDDSSSNSTKVTILLDESGSMNSCMTQTISGFNEYIDKLKSDKGKFLITLTKFNSNGVNIVYRNKNVKSVPKLSNDNYRPNGMTPLYDAIGKTVKKEKNNNLFIIITDGAENTSKEYKLSDITEIIKDCEKLGWTFIYLGADQDAWANAKSYGLSRGNVMSFSSRQMGRTMKGLAGSTISYSACSKPTKKFFKDHY